ncbi:MAG TPA: AMP-binding protein, partial [bacterium]|nr:AMP-binding protein [bacterium]
RKKFGGKLKRVICGGAPIDPSVVEFFQAIGVQVLQGYGLTEVSPTVSVNPHDGNKIGTVGLPLGCVQVRLGENDELLVKGSSLMLGYDSEEATLEAIDAEGWFHTGDQASIDEEGYITIKGRIKEMIVTSYGKNVIPSVVEQALEKHPWILQAAVFGHGKAYLSALIVPNRENVLAALGDSGLAKLDWAELCRHPEFKQKLQAALREAQADLASYEQVKRFEIVPEEFSQANDLITATLKLKRNKIQARYEPQLQAMYRGD